MERLSDDYYTVIQPGSTEEFFALIDQDKQRLDCLILEADSDLSLLANWLHGQAILLPAIIISADHPPDPIKSSSSFTEGEVYFFYHTAEICLTRSQVDQLGGYIDRAIAQFIQLSRSCKLRKSDSAPDQATSLVTQHFLRSQQQRLTEKLKERLGYLGVYYKRNPQNFFRHLSPNEKQELLDQLKLEYRDIVLRYFANDDSLNQRIDDFVNTVFFVDIPVAQVVEIHMELMDEFSKQLKLEGRSEEILLDYRLTLIDTIAHLCEMYRRSIPRES
ncbi:circadian clock protein KaiA [Leptothermofonsia sichuanensis E412]|nr:circadian clock protein KaiA [Leptothermofonsia sichuanensis E412]